MCTYMCACYIVKDRKMEVSAQEKMRCLTLNEPNETLKYAMVGPVSDIHANGT